MRLKVLAEANPIIGLGHFVRSIALAQMVSDLLDVEFYSFDDTLTRNTLEELSFKSLKISSTNDFVSYINQGDLVLMDGYDYDLDFQEEIRSRCHKLFFIDDKHDRPLSADYIINHAPGITEEDYKVTRDSIFLLGSEYALLRPYFFEKRHIRREGVSHVVVSFGGADPQNLSYEVAKILLSFNQLIKVHLIVGAAYAFLESLSEFKDDRLEVSKGLTGVDMAKAFAAADLAIVPASGVLYECLAVGTPVMAGYYIDNQSLLYKGWLEKNAIIGVEHFDLDLMREKLSQILDKGLPPFTLSARALVDGESPTRFRNIFTSIINDYGV